MNYSKIYKPARGLFAALCCVLALATFVLEVKAQDGNGDLTGERLVNARKEPQNWATYFGAYDAWRYSSLDQIRADNVKNLVPVWVFQTGKSKADSMQRRLSSTG